MVTSGKHKTGCSLDSGFATVRHLAVGLADYRFSNALGRFGTRVRVTGLHWNWRRTMTCGTAVVGLVGLVELAELAGLAALGMLAACDAQLCPRSST